MRIRAFFDRDPKSIYGWFTIQEQHDDGTITKPINRIPVTSGQVGYTHTDWVRGKSPTPRLKSGLRLWTHSVNRGERAGETGIGEAFPISSGDDPFLIQGPRGQIRLAVMFHHDNKWPGTAGCTATRKDREKDFDMVRDYLYGLNKRGIKWIQFDVV